MSAEEVSGAVSLAFLCGMLIGGVLGWIGMWLAGDRE